MMPLGIHFVRRSSTPAMVAACLCALLLSAGCRDGPSDPTALIADEETRDALSLDAGIPSVTGLSERVRSRDASIPAERLHEWSGAWQASWLAPGDEGARARSRLYDRAVEPMARALGNEGVRRAVTRTREVVSAAGAADLSRLPDRYARRLEVARRRAERAHDALEEGRTADALRAALEAGDGLRAVSPRIVARDLMERAREAHRRIPEFSTYSEEEKDRIARLIRNAGHALETGEPTLAIQRAFYACQLLGVEPF